MRLFITLIAALTLLAPAAQAQSYGQMFESVSDLNIGNPTRDPRFDTLDDVMKRRVQDRKHKVVGDVQGLLINDRGTIEALQIDFNRLRLSTPISLDFGTSGMRGVSDAYVMELYEDDQIEELFPTFLANMQTAAGQEDIMDAQNVVGAIVKSDNGRVLGKVDTLLFDNSGDRVRALYVDMKEGNYRGLSVAIPFSTAQYDFNGSRKDIILSQEQAQALTDYIESN